MKTTTGLLGAFATVCAAACSPTGSSDPTVAMWEIPDEPELSIGEMDGSPEILFTSVQRVRLLADGGVAVADGGTSTVRIFESDGGFRLELGGPGEGPGEFARLSDFWLERGDRIAAFDPGLHRVTRYEIDGILTSSTQLVPPGGRTLGGSMDVLLGSFGDGGVGAGWTAFGGMSPGETSVDRFLLTRFGADGTFQSLLAEETGLHRIFFPEGGGGPLPFSPLPYAAVVRDSLYYADGLSGHIEVRDRDGNVGRRISLPGPPGDVDAALATLESRLGDDGMYTVERLRETPRPDVIPRIAGLLADDVGRLWVRRYDADRDALWAPGGSRRTGGTWWVFDGSGEHIATVELPANLKLMDIRGDRLAGVNRDDLDVERVVVHRIGRS